MANSERCPEDFIVPFAKFKPLKTDAISESISALGEFPREHLSILAPLRGILSRMEYRQYKPARMEGLANDSASSEPGVIASLFKEGAQALSTQEGIKCENGIWRFNFNDRMFRIDQSEGLVYLPSRKSAPIRVEINNVLRLEGMNPEIASTVPALWQNPGYTWNGEKQEK